MCSGFHAGASGGGRHSYSPEELLEAFEGLVTEPEAFVWKGVETCWGRKR